MTNLLIGAKLFKLGAFKGENELGDAVKKNYSFIFGTEMVYFDIQQPGKIT